MPVAANTEAESVAGASTTTSCERSLRGHRGRGPDGRSIAAGRPCQQQSNRTVTRGTV